MNKYINKYLRNFVPYKLASHKIWTVDPDERSKILKLDWNEATIPPSPNVQKRLLKLVKEEPFYNLYPCTVNQAIVRALSSYLEIPEQNIQYFPSSDSLHEYIAKLYITVGDPILLLGPTYDNFRLTAEVCGAEIYYYNIDETFYFDQDGFLKKIDEINPSLVYICNPNNPTGTVHPISFIELLLNRYPQILFLVDEAYAEFTGVSVKNLVTKYENILISRTMSKAFALANFRFGYLIAPESHIQYISSIRNPKNITTFTQEAVLGALEDIPYMQRYVQEVNRAGRQFVADMAQHQAYVHCVYGGGNFILLQAETETIKADMLSFLMQNDIYIRDLSQTEFLRKFCTRITIGTCSQMKTVAKAIDDFFGGEEYGKTGPV